MKVVDVDANSLENKTANATKNETHEVFYSDQLKASIVSISKYGELQIKFS